MQLESYLDRIAYRGPVEPTLACLSGVHRQQALTVPYENIDIQLGRPLGQHLPNIFDKIVNRRRGGWCYEVNGLLGWALREIGFDVMRVTAGVHRRERGDAVLGNHVVLLVSLDRKYIADLGLGDGIREPLPLEEGAHRQGAMEFRLEKLADGHWRFHNHSYGNPPSFDLRDAPADEALLQSKCEALQVASEFAFVQNLACEMMGEDGVTALIGRVLKVKRASGVETRLLNSPEELEQALAGHFGIRDVPVAPLWPRIEARHREVFSEDL